MLQGPKWLPHVPVALCRVWDWKAGRLISLLRGHEADVYSGAWHPYGKIFVTCSTDDTAR